MNKFLTKFKRIVDKCDEIVIIYGDCFDLERSGRGGGSANNSHYLNLTHPLCSLSPPKSMLPCFKHNQIKNAKAHPIRTQSQGSFLLCGKYRLWYFRNHDKSPLQSSTHGGARHARIETSDFALRTFVPFFDITQYSPRSLVEKRFLSLLFSKKINQSVFPFAVCRKLSRSFCSWFHIIPCIFFLFVLE